MFEKHAQTAVTISTSKVKELLFYLITGYEIKINVTSLIGWLINMNFFKTSSTEPLLVGWLADSLRLTLRQRLLLVARSYSLELNVRTKQTVQTGAGPAYWLANQRWFVYVDCRYLAACCKFLKYVHRSSASSAYFAFL